MKSIVILSCIALFLSCQKNSDNSSNISHEFGHISVKRDGPMDDCRGEVNFNTPLTNQYLRGLLNDIADKARSSGNDVFRGYYAPENFCFKIIISNEPNAFADSFSGLLTFHSAIVTDARTDAEVSAILAHELAHVILHHKNKYSGHTYPKLPFDKRQQLDLVREEFYAKTVNFNETWKKAKILVDIDAILYHPDIVSINYEYGFLSLELADAIKYVAEYNRMCGNTGCESFHAVVDEAAQKYQSLSKLEDTMKPLLSEHYSPEEIANADEQAADEVGLELFARADFDLEYYTHFEKMMLREYLDRDPNDCLASSKDREIRGTTSHPESCWRLLNLIDEMAIHKAEYDALLSERRSFVFGTSNYLNRSQAELLGLSR